MTQLDHPHRWLVSRRGMLWTVAAAGLFGPLALARRRVASAGDMCRTTQSVPIEGPYFLGEPRAASDTGGELTLRGRVLDATSCAPVAGASVVRWHANEFGVYEDYFRAQVRADAGGQYALQTIVPGSYAGLARHVHFLVRAPGYADVITQWQLPDGQDPPTEVAFDFTLRRAGG